MIPKFRAWDTAYNRMIYSCAVGSPNLLIASDGAVGEYENGDTLANLVVYGGRYMPLQCTGAKDMHGEDIYEGDIIRKEECSPDDPAFGFYGSTGVVKYAADMMAFVIDGDGAFSDACVMKYSFDRLEVIGNIYVNPDMEERDVILHV